MSGKLTKAERKSALKRATPLGKAVRLTGAVRFFKDGDGISAVWRWWHPASWLAWLVFLPVCGLVGERINDAVPFRLSEYWRVRKGEIQWL